MKKFEGKLILSDMDGTILDDKKEISKRNIEAIKYFIDNGGSFSLATGRSKRSMEFYVELLPINAPVVVYNGSGVYDFQNNRYIFQKNMDNGCVDFVKELCKSFPFLCAEVYLTESEYVVQPNEITKRHFESIRLAMIEKRAEDIPLPWVKVNFVAPEEQVVKVEQYAKERHGKDWFYQRSGNNFFEAMSLGVDKGTGALAVCKALNFDRQNLFTIGDHMNDIELIEAAGMSFCPQNAVDAIKAISDVVVADNNSHAIESMIEYLDRVIK